MPMRWVVWKSANRRSHREIWRRKLWNFRSWVFKNS